MWRKYHRRCSRRLGELHGGEIAQKLVELRRLAVGKGAGELGSGELRALEDPGDQRADLGRHLGRRPRALAHQAETPALLDQPDALGRDPEAPVARLVQSSGRS